MCTRLRQILISYKCGSRRLQHRINLFLIQTTYKRIVIPIASRRDDIVKVKFDNSIRVPGSREQHTDNHRGSKSEPSRSVAQPELCLSEVYCIEFSNCPNVTQLQYIQFLDLKPATLTRKTNIDYGDSLCSLILEDIDTLEAFFSDPHGARLLQICH